MRSHRRWDGGTTSSQPQLIAWCDGLRGVARLGAVCHAWRRPLECAGLRVIRCAEPAPTGPCDRGSVGRIVAAADGARYCVIDAIDADHDPRAPFRVFVALDSVDPGVLRGCVLRWVDVVSRPPLFLPPSANDATVAVVVAVAADCLGAATALEHCALDIRPHAATLVGVLHSPSTIPGDDPPSTLPVDRLVAALSGARTLRCLDLRWCAAPGPWCGALVHWLWSDRHALVDVRLRNDHPETSPALLAIVAARPPGPAAATTIVRLAWDVRYLGRHAWWVDWRAVCASVAEAHPRLQHLHWGCRSLCLRPGNDDAPRSPSWPSLRTLSLDGRRRDDDWAALLVPWLGAAPALRHVSLDLRDNDLGAGFWRAFGRTTAAGWPALVAGAVRRSADRRCTAGPPPDGRWSQTVDAATHTTHIQTAAAPADDDDDCWMVDG